MSPGEAYRQGWALVLAAWKDTHAASSPRYRPQLTLPYPSEWPPGSAPCWTRYAYAVRREMPGSMLDTTAHRVEVLTKPWARVIQRGLEDVPRLEREEGQLMVAGSRVLGNADDPQDAPPLGPELLRAETDFDGIDASLIAGAYFYQHLLLTEALVEELEERHGAFFRWLAEREEPTGWRRFREEDIFSELTRPPMDSAQFERMLAEDDAEKEIWHRRARGPVADRGRVDLRVPDGGEGRELPLRLLVLGDFSNEAARGTSSPVIDVNRDAMRQAMGALAPSLDFDVPNWIEPGAPPLPVRLNFRRLSDFEPEEVAKRTAGMRQLLDLRAALTALKGPLGSEKRWREAIQKMVGDPSRRGALEDACGVVRDKSPEGLAAAREEDAVARDEAYATTDPARVAALTRHRSVFVRRAACENLALGVDALARLGPPLELLEHVASNPVVSELAATTTLFTRLERHNRLRRAILPHAPWTEDLRRWTAATDLLSLLLHVAVEMPLEPGERGVHAPGRGRDRFERFWTWCKLAKVEDWAMDAAFAQAEASVLESHLGTNESGGELPPSPARGAASAEQLRQVAERVPWLWRAVASHPQCPADVLEGLAATPQMLVRLAVAAHPATPPRTLRDLVGDPDVSVAEAAHVRAGIPFSAPPLAYVQTPQSLYYPGRNASIRSALDRLVESPLDERNPVIGLGRDRGRWVTRLLAYRKGANIPGPQSVAPRADEGSLLDQLWIATNPHASPWALEPLRESTVPFIRGVMRHRS